MILICYDGSDDARAAIARGGELLGGERATVLSVWQPFSVMATRAPMGFEIAPSLPDWEEIDRVSAEGARERAREGARLARDAGFDAEPRARPQEVTIWEVILAEARQLEASAILLGSRGLTGLKSLMLGSVSHAVIQHADRPVIIVPSPQVARSRARARHAAPATADGER